MANSTVIREIYSVIVAFLTSEKKKTEIPIAKIDQDYKEVTGVRIPFAKLGYPKLVDFLKTVPGVQIIETFNRHYVNFLGTENTRHIADLVSKQRTKYPPKSNRRYTGYTKSSQSSYTSRFYGSSGRIEKYILDYITSIMKRYPKGLSKQELSQKLRHEYGIDEKIITNLNEYLKALGKEITVKDKTVYRNSYNRSDDNKSSGSSYYEQVNLPIANNFDNNYQSTFNNYSAYASSISEDLDYNTVYFDPENNHVVVEESDLAYEVKASDCLNYNNTEQQSLNYLDINNSYQQSNLIHESSEYQENSQNETNTINQREHIFSQNKDYVSAVLNKRVQFRLEKLIQSHPEGIWCTDLPKLYEEECKVPLEWMNLGFHRLSDFAAHLSDIFHIVGPQLNGDFKLYNAKEPLPDEKPQKMQKKLTSASLFDVYSECDIEPVPTSVPASFSQRLCPDDVITRQETVGQVLVTDMSEDSERYNGKPLVQVTVVEAYSPSFFWVRPVKHTSKFEKMMASLQKFYAEDYEKYAVPIIMLERGLNIACVFHGTWHRAIIKCVDPNCRVSVMFYDFGTLSKYPPEEIFYLHRSFSALPAQAIPCGLYCIAPLEGDQWPRKVRDWFIQWVWDRPLWATIIKTDAERNSMLVTLADTSGKDDFYVNDWLIDKRMAAVRNMVCIRPKNFPYEHYLQCQSMKKSLKAGVICNQNTRLTPKIHQSSSPKIRRLNLLERLRDISNQAESNNERSEKSNNERNEKCQICPTCGSDIKKPAEQKLQVDKKLFDNIYSELKDKPLITSSPVEYYNSDRPIDKVTSWLKTLEKNYSEQSEKAERHSKNISQHFSHMEESFLVKDKIQENKMKTIIKSNHNNNCEQSKEFTSENLVRDQRPSSSPENNISKENLFVSHQGISSLVHAFEASEEISDDAASDSIAKWHGKVEFINWDEIKTEVNVKQLDNHNATTPIEEKKILLQNSSTPTQQTRTFENMNKSYKNFIKAYYPSIPDNGDILKWKSEHKIVQSDIITPMVIKTLNSINKSLEPIKIIVPEDVKKILENDSSDVSSNQEVSLKHKNSGSSLSEDQWNFLHKKIIFNLEGKNENEIKQEEKEELNNSKIAQIETMPKVLIEEIEVNTSDQNTVDDCKEFSSNEKELNSFCHTTLKMKMLERFNRLKNILEHNSSSESSALDSDDLDNESVESLKIKSQEEEKTEEFETINEHKYESTEVFLVEEKINDLVNIDENQELALVTTNSIPVFDDEDLTDDSGMDVYLQSDFVEKFLYNQAEISNNRLSIKEVESDDQDKLTEKSENTENIDECCDHSSFSPEEGETDSENYDFIDPEDLKLYVDDYENGIVNGNDSEIYKLKSDLEAAKEQISKMNEYISIYGNLFRILMKLPANMVDLTAHNFIETTVTEPLTNPIFKTIFPMMSSDSQAISPGISNQQNSQQDVNLSAVGSEDRNNNSCNGEVMESQTEGLKIEPSSIVDVSTSIVSKEISRNKLEASIKNAADNFFGKINAANSENVINKKFNPFTESLHDTNPFKKDLTISDEKEEKKKSKPPPLPPRPHNYVMKNGCPEDISKSLQHSPLKIIYESPPVMYDLSKGSLRLDHSNMQTEDFNRCDEGSQNDKSLLNSQENHQTCSGSNSNSINEMKIHNGIDSHIVDSTNPFESSQVDLSNTNKQVNKVNNQNFSVCYSEGKKYTKVENNIDGRSIPTKRALVQSELTMCQVIFLSKSKICVFHFDNEMWITVDEFRLTFTNIDSNESIFYVPIKFKVVSEEEYPLMFEHFSNVRGSFVEDKNKETDKLIMIQLKSIAELLLFLNVISLDDIRNFLMMHRICIPSQLIDLNKLTIEAFVFFWNFFGKRKN